MAGAGSRGREEAVRLEGPGARLADWTWTLREPEVMRGRPPAEPPKGPGRDRGSQGPALKVFPPGPRPEERREPCLPGLGGGSFPGRRRDCFPLPPPTTPAPHTHPRPAPAVSQPRPLGKDPFRPERSCPRGPRNRQAGRRRERSRATPLIPRCGSRAPLYLAGRSAPGDFCCCRHCPAFSLPPRCHRLHFVFWGTDFRWCDTGDRYLSGTRWVARITSICSKNKHRLPVGVVQCPVPSAQFLQRLRVAGMVEEMALFTPLTAGGMALSFFFVCVLPHLLKRR